jgi:NAD(P)-dependent dehydrogenase (short-subunit alcohol dehydrogenase family)
MVNASWSSLFLLTVSIASSITCFSDAAMSSSSLRRLAGKRILVTGAGRGIGRAIALICSTEGANVAISSRTLSELEETIALATSSRSTGACLSEASSEEENNNNNVSAMDPYVVDVTNKEQVESMVQDIVQKWGGIDILVNNAGRGQTNKGTCETLDADELRSLLDLNVVGVQIVTSAVLQQTMLPAKAGKIINISSKAGKVGLPQLSFYVASKFALEGLTASLAEELKDKNIQVNSISPGMVDTISFPKPKGRKGVRSAESVKDGLMALLDSQVTGHYLHVDELDLVRERGFGDSAAMKPINEPTFDP